MILERLFPTEKRVLSNDEIHRQSFPYFDGLVWVLIWKYDKYMNYGRAICSSLSYVSLVRNYMYSCFKCSSISRRAFHNALIRHPIWHLIRPTFESVRILTVFCLHLRLLWIHHSFPPFSTVMLTIFRASSLHINFTARSASFVTNGSLLQLQLWREGEAAQNISPRNFTLESSFEIFEIRILKWEEEFQKAYIEKSYPIIRRFNFQYSSIKGSSS